MTVVMKIASSRGSRRFALAIVCFASLPATGFAWKAENRLDVNPLPGSDAFEVVGRPGSAGADYWCAAGDYALRVLAAPAEARIYITRARGVPETSNRLEAVHFSLTPGGGETRPTPPFLSMRRVGDNLSIAFARTFCAENKEFGL